MEHPPYNSDMASTDFWLFPKMKFSLKGRRFQDNEDIQKKCANCTESYSTTGVPKMLTIVAGSIIGQSAYVLKGSTLKVTNDSWKYVGMTEIKSFRELRSHIL